MATTLSPDVKRRLFTSQEYDRMVEAGILHEDDRVELIEGEIIQMAPMGSPHAARVSRSIMLFTDRFRDVACMTSRTPVVLGDLSEAEPDLMLLQPRSDFYAGGLPTPTDVLLLLELSDSTFSFDRKVKVPLYARDGIPEVWQAGLPGGTLTVFRDPSPEGYRASLTIKRGDRIAPLAFPGREIAVSDILG